MGVSARPVGIEESLRLVHAWQYSKLDEHFGQASGRSLSLIEFDTISRHRALRKSRALSVCARKAASVKSDSDVFDR